MSDFELAVVLRSAQEAIGPDGELPYRQRRALRAALRQSWGHERAWQFLELICARKVLPIWSSRFPAEQEPAALVSGAEDYLLGRREVIAPARLASAKTYLDDKFLLGEEAFRAIYAGFACWAAARTVLITQFVPVDADSEQEIDPSRWDASFMASLAYSGGAVWEGAIGDSALRRGYWVWFLTEAIAAAQSRASQLYEEG